MKSSIGNSGWECSIVCKWQNCLPMALCFVVFFGVLHAGPLRAQNHAPVAYSIGLLYGIEVQLPENVLSLHEDWQSDAYFEPVGFTIRWMRRSTETARVGLALDAVISSYNRDDVQYLLIAQLRPALSFQGYNNRDYRGFYIKADLGAVATYVDSNVVQDDFLEFYPSVGMELGLSIPFGYRVSLDPHVKLAADIVNTQMLINVTTGVTISF